MREVPHTYEVQENGIINTAIKELGNQISQMVNSLRSPSMRPYARAVIHGESIACLFDTGADVSCINSKIYEKVSPCNQLNAIEGLRPLKAAGGQMLKVHGVQKIELEIDGRKVKHPFLVIDDLNESMILGIDFITKQGLNYSPATREFTWEDGASTWQQGFCQSIKKETIPALSSRLIKVNLITTGGGKPSKGEVVNACAAAEGKPLLSGTQGVIAHQDGVAMIMVQNCAPVDVKVKRGELIGRIENLTGCEMTEIRSLTEAEQPKVGEGLIGSISVQPTKPMEKDIKFIRENVNLNVPEKFKKEYLSILYENHGVISRHKDDLGRSNTLQHEISLKSKEPVYVKQFRIPEAHRKQAEQQVVEWLKLGVVEPCRSKYNSPLFMVNKKDGGLRIVQDFRALNTQTMEDKYSMHDVSECVAQIGRAGSTIFTTIDLTSGFWQMVLHPDSRPYTAFTLPGKGQHQWTVAPMGLLGSPASFQRLVETALKGISNVIVYIDDLLIHTQDHQHHIQVLRNVFQRLGKHKLKINLKKCFFGSTNVAYLGFRLTPQGILPGSDKLKAVGQTAPPATVKEVRQFLGLCNFFRTHVKNFALVSSPLTVLTKKDSPWKKGPLPPESYKAYRELQTILCSEPVVAYPRSNRTYALITDASLGDDKKPGGLGAILTQIDEKGKFYVIAYASRKLSKHEQNYTAFLVEMQAAVWAMDHFDVNLKGRHFILYTDHKPLEKLGKVHTKTLNRLQEKMNQFSFQIIYKKGSEMPADYLSRNALDVIKLDNNNINNLQNQDILIVAIKDFLFNRLLPEDDKLSKLVKHFAEDCFISDDILWRRIVRGNDLPRVVLFTPSQMTKELIQQVHGQLLTGHDGVFKTKERLLESYYWPGMDKQILEFVKTCHKCQVTKKYHPLGKQPIQPLPQCSQLNQRIHADLFGPLKTSEKGKKYILCITDAFTKYVELVAIPDKEAATIATAIFQKWICRYGSPLQITTDNGKEFCAKLSENLFEQLGSLHLTTSPYHPQCNSQVEIVNKTIAKYLASFVDETTLDWELYLPPLMFCYNTSVHTSTKTSPHFLTYGYFPRLPMLFGSDLNQVFYGENTVDEMMTQLQHARRIAAQNNDDIRDKYTHLHDKILNPQKFQISQKVLIDDHQFLHKNRKLAPKYNGPFVINKLFDTNAEITGKNGRKSIVHLNRLKPYQQAQDLDTPHFLDLYKNGAPLPPLHGNSDINLRNTMASDALPRCDDQQISENLFFDNGPTISTEIRKKRGRPRKIVCNNLFNNERDVSNKAITHNGNGNISQEIRMENNANEIHPDNSFMASDNNIMATDKRMTRSNLNSLPNEIKQNYFQSLNSLEKENYFQSLNSLEKENILSCQNKHKVFSQQIFTIITKKKRIKNGSSYDRFGQEKWSRKEKENFARFGDIYECTQSSGYSEAAAAAHGVAPDIPEEQPGSDSDESANTGSEEDEFNSAASGSTSEEEELENEPAGAQGPPALLPVPGPGMSIIRPYIPPNVRRGGGHDHLSPTQISPADRIRMSHTSPMSPGIRLRAPSTISPPFVLTRRTPEVQRPLGTQVKDLGGVGYSASIPMGQRRGISGTRTGGLSRTPTGDHGSRRSTYDHQDRRSPGIPTTGLSEPRGAAAMADYVGLTGREITAAERNALVDDAFLTKEAITTPLSGRARSTGRQPTLDRSQLRRSKTPQGSKEEEAQKNTLTGVRHAKARLILDKRDEAAGKPAQLFKSTRSTTTAPDIWPIKAPSPPKKKIIRESAFETKPKLARTPPK